MLRSRRTATVLASLATATALSAALLTPARAAAPTVDLQPQQLTRGADIAVPHIEDGQRGDVFVDGARRVELPGRIARVLGRSGDSWLVGTNNVDRKRNRRVVRVAPDGSVTDVLRDVDPAGLVLSEDGSALFAVVRPRRGAATVKVWGALLGTDAAERTFRGYPEIVTASGSKVLLRTTTRTFFWNWARDEVRRPLTTAVTGLASMEHDLLSVYTKDPYLGGCTKLVRLSKPRVKVWKSCRDRVAAISPDGTEMLTFHILTDGLGPNEVRLRGVDGTRLATYRTNWFGGWGWESPGTVLLDVNGKHKAATVRCTLDACENATDPVKVQVP
ncbi:hypothetical protein GCM10011376_19680 [Nocardioides flavus (ex Wang et al. 2016)]|uniref:Uncharacterized protein n=1 Tax=Nocardioides flavus (ex Wang et al. 2016) TaxID=2058780 RepID=A0ABQ3HKC2_9ACTN|nr:hypothetical protein [Nocardioides flavus (ex Wang et al. 2016)]GHE17358.1 hypothetical protein GCM10011376_19680 [Nocardioides flavus (ex Wang et al. 2016)]